MDVAVRLNYKKVCWDFSCGHALRSNWSVSCQVKKRILQKTNIAFLQEANLIEEEESSRGRKSRSRKENLLPLEEDLAHLVEKDLLKKTNRKTTEGVFPQEANTNLKENQSAQTFSPVLSTSQVRGWDTSSLHGFSTRGCQLMRAVGGEGLQKMRIRPSKMQVMQ